MELNEQVLLCNDPRRDFTSSAARNNKLYRVWHGFSELGISSKALRIAPSVEAVVHKAQLGCLGKARKARAKQGTAILGKQRLF